MSINFKNLDNMSLNNISLDNVSNARLDNVSTKKKSKYILVKTPEKLKKFFEKKRIKSEKYDIFFKGHQCEQYLSDSD